MLRRTLLVVSAAVMLAPPASAQETLRVRGVVEAVDGSTLRVRSRDGTELTIVIGERPTFTAIIKADRAELKPGAYVGATALPQADGSLAAVEVHIFPEAMRGVGEGHRPWDLQPQSTMTNASVETAVSAVDGQVLTLKYKDGEKKIRVRPQTAIVTYAPGDRAELKPGTAVFLFATRKTPDGRLEASRVSYGRDGLVPPM